MVQRKVRDKGQKHGKSGDQPPTWRVEATTDRCHLEHFDATLGDEGNWEPRGSLWFWRWVESVNEIFVYKKCPIYALNFEVKDVDHAQQKQTPLHHQKVTTALRKEMQRLPLTAELPSHKFGTSRGEQSGFAGSKLEALLVKNGMYYLVLLNDDFVWPYFELFF